MYFHSKIGKRTFLVVKFIGKRTSVHSALDKFLSNKEYNIKRAYVLSNEQQVYTEKGITYMPIYYVMFFQNESNVVEQFLD